VRGWLSVDRSSDISAGTPPTPEAPPGSALPPQPPTADEPGPPVADGAAVPEAAIGPPGAATAEAPEAAAVPAGAPAAGEPAAGKSKRKAKSSRRKQGYEWLVLVAASLAVALFVRAFLIQAFYIPSESMVPTLVTNDRVLVNKLSYKLHDVHRGDIVVFDAPPGAATAQIKDLIKRVVGLPGDTIEGRSGSIFIDGKPLDEPYLPPDVRSRDFPPAKVPPKEVWVLGDNRQDSRDSTFFGPIPENSIVGRAFVKIWPLNDIGLL
jgi:signal peptidase I